MLAGREPVALLAITLAIRQHEVVRQIHWVSSPSDKVVYMSCVPHDPAIAVEAPTLLKIEQHRSNYGHTVALAAEQEFAQVGGSANQGQVLLAHIPDPCALHQMGECFDPILRLRGQHGIGRLGGGPPITVCRTRCRADALTMTVDGDRIASDAILTRGDRSAKDNVEFQRVVPKATPAHRTSRRTAVP